MKSIVRLVSLPILAFFLLALSGCNLLKKQATGELVFEFEKTACFGNCPIYTMQFFSNGTIKLDGKQFMDKLGLFELQLDKDEIQTMVTELETMDFCNLESLYGSNAMDFPSTFVRYKCDGELKTVEAVTDFPEQLLAFIKEIDALRKLDNWVATGANETSN